MVPLCTFCDSFVIGFLYLVQSVSLQNDGEQYTRNLKFQYKESRIYHFRSLYILL